MAGRRRTAAHATVAALWTLAIPGVSDAMTEEMRRTVLAGAVTATILGYIHRRAADRDALMRLGLWAGAAIQRDRCTMMHDHDAKRGTAAADAAPPAAGAVDSAAWPLTQRSG